MSACYIFEKKKIHRPKSKMIAEARQKKTDSPTMPHAQSKKEINRDKVRE